MTVTHTIKVTSETKWCSLKTSKDVWSKQKESKSVCLNISVDSKIKIKKVEVMTKILRSIKENY